MNFFKKQSNVNIFFFTLFLATIVVLIFYIYKGVLFCLTFDNYNLLIFFIWAVISSLVYFLCLLYRVVKEELKKP